MPRGRPEEVKHESASRDRGAGSSRSPTRRRNHAGIASSKPGQSGLRETVAAESIQGTGIGWRDLTTDTLHSYRHAYRLNTPSAFKSSLNQMILIQPGIGRQSPTMARSRDKRRVGKDQLANSVRKNFNAMGITEGEVVADFLYKVKAQDKSFRMRFSPNRPR